MIKAMEETQLPVTAIDAPSSWSIEEGPPKSGVGSNFSPAVLVSLTAPKPLVNYFKGRHFIGGRYEPFSPPSRLPSTFTALAHLQIRHAVHGQEVRCRASGLRGN